MSLTVEKCMSLPAFRHAKIVAGYGGITQSVESITVLEYAGDISLISSDLFLNHEMCITCFASIKDDVDAQCAVIRKMKEIGVCAIVLYYIGIFLPTLDERLISTANEVDLPLICMPSNRINFRYGEAINDVIFAISRNQEKDLNIISEMFERISALPEGIRTLRRVLQMISDRFHSSFFLINQNGTLVSDGQWPQSANWNYQKIVSTFLVDEYPISTVRQVPLILDGKEVHITHASVLPERNPQMHLFAVDEQASITFDHVSRAAELIALFMNISNYTLEETTPEMIIRSIISNDSLRARELAAKHHINLSNIQNMWVLNKKRGQGSDFDNKRELGNIVFDVRRFFRNKDKWVLADISGNSIIIFFQASSFADLDTNMGEELLEQLDISGYKMNLIRCNNTPEMQSARDSYQLIEKYFDTARVIYPERSIFDSYDMRFAERLRLIISNAGTALSRYLYTLEPIRQGGNYEMLLETLAVYLLDAESNSQQAADLLNVHKNTIRYRMKQIQECFTCDITQMPLASELYDAVALQRLLKKE